MIKNVYVKTTKDKGTVKLIATSNNETVERVTTHEKVNSKEKLALWILNQLPEAKEDLIQGVLEINYHIKTETNEGEPFDYYVIDNVTKSPLPTVLTKEVDELEQLIDNISDINGVKLALKNVVQAVSFMKSFL